jgi:hypothetical protein
MSSFFPFCGQFISGSADPIDSGSYPDLNSEPLPVSTGTVTSKLPVHYVRYFAFFAKTAFAIWIIIGTGPVPIYRTAF